MCGEKRQELARSILFPEIEQGRLILSHERGNPETEVSRNLNTYFMWVNLSNRKKDG